MPEQSRVAGGSEKIMLILKCILASYSIKMNLYSIVSRNTNSFEYYVFIKVNHACEMCTVYIPFYL